MSNTLALKSLFQLKTRKQFIGWIATITIIVALMCAAILSRVVFRGDDPWFAAAVVNYSAFDWIVYRWDTWSSRILPELMLWVFTPRPMWLWVTATTVIYIAYIALLYQFYTLLNGKRDYKTDLAAYIVISLTPLLMATSVMDDALLWMTGSVNYFWVAVLFLAALYTPVYILVKEKLPPMLTIILSIFCASVVAVSQEQFALILLGIIATISIYFMLQHWRNIPWKVTGYLLVLSSVALVGFLITILAPGNEKRAEQELMHWLPDMYTIAPLVRIESDIRWFIDKVINHTGVLLPILWVGMASILWGMRRRVLPIILIASATILTIMQFSTSNIAAMKALELLQFDYLVNFNAEWGYIGGEMSWLPIVLWSAVLLCTLLGLWVVFTHKKPVLVFSIAILIFGAGSLAALWVSPTMYASGYRVVFPLSLSILVVIISVFAEILLKKKIRRKQITTYL